MEEENKEWLKLLGEFINTALDVNHCMKNKCKIIDEKVTNNPKYKELILAFTISKTDKDRKKLINHIMKAAEYPEYTQCQYKNCNKNIKNLIIIVLKLYHHYITYKNNKLPKDVNNAIIKLKTAIDNNEELFQKYDKETTILLTYVNQLK